MSEYLQEDIDPGVLAHMTAIASELTDEVRSLVRATVVTDADDDAVARAREHIREATALLGSRELPGAFGVRFNSDGTKRSWGNAVIGLRNPVAPPLELIHSDGKTWAEVDLGPQYEGPAGLVHGGILAAILDQVLGSAAEHAGAPGMTGTLTIRYRMGTGLGRVRAEAWLDRQEGVKSFAKGTISTDAGICAEAEGVFILPRWAREESAAPLRSAVGDA